MDICIACVQADTTLSKANRASAFDAGKNLRAEIISHGMESSISSGNWSIKRFRMERKGVTQARLLLTLSRILQMSVAEALTATGPSHASAWSTRASPRHVFRSC